MLKRKAEPQAFLTIKTLRVLCVRLLSTELGISVEDIAGVDYHGCRTASQ